jgi:hypothetical protein
MTIAEYLDRRDRLTNTLFIINSDGQGYYVEDHKMYTREEFRRKYPTPVSLAVNNGVNCDKTKSFLGTD